jgi:three-Cys-motif partner protein
MKDDFFAVKREWSKLKDQILDEYLRPYLTKILETGRPTRIVDCFAGKGKFDDGTPGSPLIIARHMVEQQTRKPAADLHGIFIEPKYAADLLANLAAFPNCEVLPDDYERCIQYFLSQPRNAERNYFFYVDPYGIKYLDFRYFQKLKAVGFRSLELLLNLNTTGFLREGCRLLNLARAVPEWADNPDHENDGKNTTVRMDDIAGGDYWQTILVDFQTGAIDFHQAEESFIGGYTRRLGNHFKYVVNIPIKERIHLMPKYRLVFATDYHDGLFLMADEMHAAWRKLLDQEKGAQLYLFDETELAALHGPSIQDKILAELQQSINLRDLLIRLIRKHGIAHTTGEYKKSIKEGEGKSFNVVREPAKTPTGRPSQSMDHKEVRIMVGIMPKTRLPLHA